MSGRHDVKGSQHPECYRGGSTIWWGSLVLAEQLWQFQGVLAAVLGSQYPEFYRGGSTIWWGSLDFAEQLWQFQEVLAAVLGTLSCHEMVEEPWIVT